MKFVVDENVSYELVTVLRQAGFQVTAIAETPTAGLGDENVFKITGRKQGGPNHAGLSFYECCSLPCG